MKVPPITSKNMKITIPAGQPKLPYLYNQVLDMVKEVHAPSEFRSTRIDISTVTSKQTQKVIEKLNQLGASYSAKAN